MIRRLEICERQPGMKVCVINPNFYRSSGVSVAIKRLYEGAVDLPIEWHFVSCRHGDAVECAPIDWLRPGTPEETHWPLMSHSPLRVFFGVLGLVSYLRSKKIDVVHVHHRRIALIVGPVCKLLGIGLVYTGHLVYGRSRIRVLRWANAAIAISKAVRGDIENNEANGLKIFDISNATPFTPVEQHVQPPGPVKLLCAARLEPVKNHKALIKAWALTQASKHGGLLTLLGEGSLRGELEQLASSLGVADSVRFEGFQTNVSAYIDAAHFLILTSYVEGQPLAVLEGAARGKPSLLSNVDGSRDCVPPHHGQPNLFEPDDHLKLSELIDIWAARVGREISAEGKVFFEYWSNRASPRAVAERHLEVYRSCA
jgi:glycosyltransferase involved in cell wall biosynthesis